VPPRLRVEDDRAGGIEARVFAPLLAQSLAYPQKAVVVGALAGARRSLSLEDDVLEGLLGGGQVLRDVDFHAQSPVLDILIWLRPDEEIALGDAFEALGDLTVELTNVAVDEGVGGGAYGAFGFRRFGRPGGLGRRLTLR